jgi:hypothetical protein
MAMMAEAGSHPGTLVSLTGVVAFSVLDQNQLDQSQFEFSFRMTLQRKKFDNPG